MSYRIIPQGKPAPQKNKIAPTAADGPVTYSFTLPSGVTVKGQLGRNKDEPVRGLEAFETGNRRMRVEQKRLEQEVNAQKSE